MSSLIHKFEFCDFHYLQIMKENKNPKDDFCHMTLSDVMWCLVTFAYLIYESG